MTAEDVLVLAVRTPLSATPENAEENVALRPATAAERYAKNAILASRLNDRCGGDVIPQHEVIVVQRTRDTSRRPK